MRAADPAIQLIAWGDSGWAGRMADVAGEQVQYLAFHHMFDPDSPNSRCCEASCTGAILMRPGNS